MFLCKLYTQFIRLGLTLVRELTREGGPGSKIQFTQVHCLAAR